MIVSLDPLTDLVNAVRACLIADPYFSGLAVLTHQRGDLINEIERELEKLGLVIVIESLPWTPEYEGDEYNLYLNIGITVTEMPLINQSSSGSRKNADAVAARIVAILNPFRGAPANAEKVELVNDTDGLVSHLITAKADARYALAQQ